MQDEDFDTLMEQEISSANRGSPAEIERVLSLLVGGALVLDGLGRQSLAGMAEAAAGGLLAIGAIRGRAPVSHGVARRMAAGDVDALPARRLLRVQKSFTIARTPEELYGMWRRLEALPSYLSHLESVTEVEGGRSKWVARGPLGVRVEWTAEITADEPGRRIAWRSVEGSQIAHTGSIRFDPAPVDRGTEVHVVLEYAPPAGATGDLMAKMLGSSPERTVQEDLRRFKQLAEAGEVATTEGQTSGRRDVAKQEVGTR